MRKHLSFVCGFALGALCVTGTVRLSLVPRLFAQSISTSSESSPFPNVLSKPGVTLIRADAAKPRVPDFWYHLRGRNVGDVVQLDGMDCDGCVLRSRLLSYAGGQFRCKNCSIMAQGISFEGAAYNTLQVLQLAGAIPHSQTGTSSIPLSTESQSAVRVPADWVSVERKR